MNIQYEFCDNPDCSCRESNRKKPDVDCPFCSSSIPMSGIDITKWQASDHSDTATLWEHCCDHCGQSFWTL